MNIAGETYIFKGFGIRVRQHSNQTSGYLNLNIIMGKIALIGAAGQIGTPLGLLCKSVSNDQTTWTILE